LEELRALFSGYLGVSGCGVVNFDNEEARALGEASVSDGARQMISFAIENPAADITVKPGSITQGAFFVGAVVVDTRTDEEFALKVPMPGMHNLSNALAALAASSAAGIEMGKAVAALAEFKGLARRFDVIGTSAKDVTVIDDFGHNPEKCAATLRTLKATEGRVIAFFQPHGYGPLRQMGDELAETFARELGSDDITIMCDPVYFGGTVDRSEGTERIIKMIEDAGGSAQHIELREDCGKRILEIAQPGDRIVVMGARDDTLTGFAHSILDGLE
ncbi:MAG: Mur ligase family protein, partial [Pseudomonadota bacterium]